MSEYLGAVVTYPEGEKDIVHILLNPAYLISSNWAWTRRYVFLCGADDTRSVEITQTKDTTSCLACLALR